MRKNTVEPHRSQTTIWRMRTACWITKATNTHSENVILVALPLQQWAARTRLSVTLYVQCLPVFLFVPEASNYNGRFYHTLLTYCMVQSPS